MSRYLLASWVAELLVATRFPHAGVLTVNLIGCFLIGVFSAVLSDATIRAAVLTGFLGGFTTYSAFAMLTHELASSGRWRLFALQMLLHVLGGLLCAALGLRLGRAF